MRKHDSLQEHPSQVGEGGRLTHCRFVYIYSCTQVCYQQILSLVVDSQVREGSQGGSQVEFPEACPILKPS